MPQGLSIATIKKILPASILLLACIAAWALVRETPTLETKNTKREAPLVEIVTAQPKELRLNVFSQGVVSPRTEIELVSEVAGKVVAIHSAFAAGGFFKKDEILLRIDARDYQFAVVRAQAQVAEARKELLREQGEADQAKQEWQELGNGKASPFVLRLPHLEERRAKLAAAKADLDEARLRQQRCNLRAPFDGRIRSKKVDIGQYVRAEESLAQLYATDVAEIRLPIVPEQLEFVELPMNFADRTLQSTLRHPAVTLRAQLGGRKYSWQGRVVRSEGALDEKTGMFYAVAQVPEPYGYREDRPPLAVGQFVHAEIAGIARENLVKLPNSALRSGYQVFLVDNEDRLRLRTVEVLRREDDGMVVSGGVDPGARVMVSGVELPVEGMRVRVKPHNLVTSP